MPGYFSQDTKECLEELLARPGVGLAKIRAPHGSGKSTTLVAWIWKFIENLRSSGKVYTLLYLKHTLLEAELLYEYLTSRRFHDGVLKDFVHPINLLPTQAPLKSKVMIMTSESFKKAVDIFKVRAAFGGDVVILLDEEIAPSADGELVKGLIISLVEEQLEKKPLLSAKIISLSLPADDEKMKPFESRLKAKVTVCPVRSPCRDEPNAHAEVFDSKDGTPLAKDISTAVCFGTNVVSFLPSSLTLRLWLSVRPNVPPDVEVEIVDLVATSSLALKHIRPVFLDTDDASTVETTARIICVPASLYSTCLPFRNVGLVLSPGYMKFRDLDRTTSLVVGQKRPLSAGVLAVHHSIASPRLRCDYPPAKVLEPDFKFGSAALGRDIMFFTFQAVHYWPDTPLVDIPVTVSHRDIAAVKEAAYRLKLMGLVEHRGNGYAVTQSIGTRLFELLPRVACGELLFSGACMIAGIPLSMPQKLKRIIIRLAVIESRLGDLVHLLSDKAQDLSAISSPEMQLVSDSSWGPAAVLVVHGNLWAALGLWEMSRVKNMNFSFSKGKSLEDHVVEGVVCLDSYIACEVYRAVVQLEREHGMGHMYLDEDFERDLTSDELRLVQKQLMIAHLPDLLLVPVSPRPGMPSITTIASITPVELGAEVLVPLLALRLKSQSSQAFKEGAELGYIGIPGGLVKMEDGGLLAPELTIIEASMLMEIQRMTGRPVSQALASTSLLL